MKTKKLLVSAFLLLGFALSTGCESMSNTAKGGLIGGGAGAGLGAVAGGGKGALIGGLAGGLLGGIVGNDMDSQEKKDQQAKLAAAEARPTTIVQQAPPLGLTDVIQMSKEGTNETVIINQIRNTGSTYQLSNEDIRFLQANSVSPNVIIEMQNRRPVARVIQQPVYYQRPVYYAPPPPVVGATYIYTR